jgi:hypothetical protein
MVNKRQIGTIFEKEAFILLKEKFDSVEWLSKKHKHTFDFRCIKDGKEYYVDAKFLSRDSKPTVLYSQKDVDFIIAKINGNIYFFNKEQIKKRCSIHKKHTILIQVSDDTWLQLNKRKQRGESFEQVIQRMILETPEVKE